MSKKQQSKAWPLVPLSEVLTQVSDPHVVKTDHEYPNFGIFSFGRGLFPKPPILGMETRATTLYRVRQDQFIYSRLFAFEGAYGLVTGEYDGWFVSNEYPIFDCDETRLFPAYLAAYFWMPSIWQEVARLSTGLGDRRRRVQPNRFLTHSIPLPPLPEQRCIVAKIEEVAAKIQEARRLRHLAAAECESVMTAAAESLVDCADWPVMPLGNVLREDSRNGLGSRPSDSPPGLPILRISAGTSRPDGVVDESDHRFLDLSPTDAATYALRPGDLLACRFNGNLHFVGRFSLYLGYSGQQQVFPDKLIRFRVDQARLLPAFVRYAMNSPQVRRIVESYCTTTAGNIGISATTLKTIRLPVPPLTEQHRAVACLDDVQAKVDTMRALQVKSAAELDALLPSILDKAFNGELA